MKIIVCCLNTFFYIWITFARLCHAVTCTVQFRCAVQSYNNSIGRIWNNFLYPYFQHKWAILRTGFVEKEAKSTCNKISKLSFCIDRGYMFFYAEKNRWGKHLFNRMADKNSIIWNLKFFKVCDGNAIKLSFYCLFSFEEHLVKFLNTLVHFTGKSFWWKYK
jgi:hypothetical protein